MKRLALAIMVIALIAALMAPTAQAQQEAYCWWNGIDQSSGQDITSGTAEQTISVGPRP